MATHSSALAWKIPWTEEPGGLQSMGSQRVGYNWQTKQRQQDTWVWDTSVTLLTLRAPQSTHNLKQHRICQASGPYLFLDPRPSQEAIWKVGLERSKSEGKVVRTMKDSSVNIVRVLKIPQGTSSGCLGLATFSARDPGSIPGWDTKISQARSPTLSK